MDRTINANSVAQSSDSLLPGRGHTPNYGIGDSGEESFLNTKVRETNDPQRWYMVAMCALIACIASIFGGMSLSFSSILINELTDHGLTNDDLVIDKEGTYSSLIGVSVDSSRGLT